MPPADTSVRDSAVWLAAQLITMHNIRFSQRLMAGVRQAIAEDRLMDFRNECIAKGMFD